GQARNAGCDARADTPAVVDQDVFASVASAPEAPQQPAVGVGDGHDLEVATPHDGVALLAAHLVFGVTEAAEPRRVVVEDHDAVLVAHDPAVARLDDDDAAALVLGLLPLAFELVDVAEARAWSRLGLTEARMRRGTLGLHDLRRRRQTRSLRRLHHLRLRCARLLRRLHHLRLRRA